MNRDITTEEAIEIYNGLNNFVQKDVTLPAQVAWDIDDNLETLKKIASKFEEYQNKILKPLQDNNELIETDDHQLVPKKGFEKDYIEALQKVNEYRKTKNSIEVKTMKKSQIPENVSVKDIRALKFMLEDEKEEKENE